MSQNPGRINNGNLKYETEKHVGEMKQGSNNILVAVRVRPLLKKEAEINSYETLQVLDQQVITLIDPEKEGNLDVISRKNRDKSTQFAFDYAFDKMTTQKQVFDCTTSPLIGGVLDGFNCTIFAYGATGAGKTYTMVGTPDDPGIMQRTLNQLYIQIGKETTTQQVTLKASYLEIYNETIKDLLTTDDSNLEIREDPVIGVQVINLSEIEVNSTKEIMNLMQTGNRNRTMEPTKANEFSSRSHAILQISIEKQERNQGIGRNVQQSKLSLVDLAGSERAAKTDNRGQRLIEGAKINQSLLTLGNCIHALAEQQERHLKSNNTHIPYRGSKLTRLLKDSLGGNCRTVMISNVSPSIDSVEDTYNTLTYANRAKMIKTNVKRNVVNVESHISNYTNIIDGLRKENQVLKKMLHDKEKMDPNGNSIGGGNNQEQRLQQQAHSMQDVVKQNKQRQQVTKYERELNVHFKEEIDVLRQVYEQEQKVEAQQYVIFRTLTQLNQLDNKLGTEAQVLKEKAENQKMELKQLTQERDEIKEVYRKLKDLRNAKIIDIRQKDLSTSKIGFLMGVYKQGQLMAENQEILFKEKQVEERVNQKELQIAFLHNQMIARDSVINEQKEIINENNLKNDVNYKYVKSIKQITEEAKLNFPIVNKKMELVYSMPQLNKKQYIPQKYQKGQTRNNSQQQENIFQQQLNYDEYEHGEKINQNQSIVRQKYGNYGKNGVFHYQKDYQEHKKNANDFLHDNRYQNDKVKIYNDKKKEQRLQQLDYPPNEAAALFPDIEQNSNKNKLSYKNGRLQRNEDVEIDEVKEKKKKNFIKNQMNSQQRQDQFLYEFKQKQKQKKLEREGGLRQSSFSDLNSSLKHKDPTIGEKYNQNYSQVYGNQPQINKYIVNDGIVKKGHQQKKAPKFMPDTESLYSYRINTPADWNRQQQQQSQFKNFNDNDSMYRMQTPSHHQHGGNQNTIDIIKKLETQAPQRSNIKTKVELHSVLNERKNIDPLAKERDEVGRVNLNKVYNESPYVKSFLKKTDNEKRENDRFQIHKQYVDEEELEQKRQQKIKEQQKIYKSKFADRQKYIQQNQQLKQQQQQNHQE